MGSPKNLISSLSPSSMSGSPKSRGQKRKAGGKNERKGKKRPNLNHFGEKSIILSPAADALAREGEEQRRLLRSWRSLSAFSSEDFDFFAWGRAGGEGEGVGEGEVEGEGEGEGDSREPLPPLSALRLLPSPCSHLVASRDYMGAIDKGKHIFVWKNKKKDEGKDSDSIKKWQKFRGFGEFPIVHLSIAGPSAAGGPSETAEDPASVPYHLAAVTSEGIDFAATGSISADNCTERVLPGLRGVLADTLGMEAACYIGDITDVSVGTVTSANESPFIGYITDKNRVYIRTAKSDLWGEEVHCVEGYTGKAEKIQCGASHYAIILTDDGTAWTWGDGSVAPPPAGSGRSFSEASLHFSKCIPAGGSLYGRKVIDVGCCAADFVALTEDGEVHHWTHGTHNPLRGVFNAPSPPLMGNRPNLKGRDLIVSVSIGAGVCAGVTREGRVHTWRNGMMGGLTATDEETPLGREEGSDTQVQALGEKLAVAVLAVPGSLLVTTVKGN